MVNADRFIPAGAGNTSLTNPHDGHFTVYPRWRGEHYELTTAGVTGYGLSPLARGTPAADRLYLSNRRFIPAGAGNTRASILPSSSRPVYPRWRGEHCICVLLTVDLDGLSPLARGTRRMIKGYGVIQRFIPAGAGNTDGAQRRRQPVSVYPRWRGEHHHSKLHNLQNPGLSPLARGTL